MINYLFFAENYNSFNSIYLFRGYGDVYLFNCNTNTLSFLFNINPSYLYIDAINIVYNTNNNQIYSMSEKVIFRQRRWYLFFLCNTLVTCK